MDGLLAAQAFDIEKLTNFGVPAALLFYPQGQAPLQLGGTLWRRQERREGS